MLVLGHGGVGLVRSHVRSHALALMENLDGGGRGPHVYDLPCQLIRHTVEAAVELDVIVDVDRSLRPLGEIKVLSGQRPQRRLIERADSC
jgi:hypothetical protein